MPAVLTKILISLLWAAIGAASAWFSLYSLKKQAEAISPDNAAALTQVPRMMAGRMLRLILVGVVIYLALRMGALYAIVFVVALTVTTWVLVVALNKQADKSTNDLKTR